MIKTQILHKNLYWIFPPDKISDFLQDAEIPATIEKMSCKRGHKSRVFYIPTTKCSNWVERKLLFYIKIPLPRL